MSDDPSTAFLDSWQAFNFIETGDYLPPDGGEPVDHAFGLKIKRSSKRVSAALGRPIASNSTTEGFIVWNPRKNKNGRLVQPRFMPEVNGMIILPDGGWLIDQFTKAETGEYFVSVTKARSNAGVKA